ncbi:MAG: exodeoxyribonuclease VII large subunit [Desulfobacteraceae bacterium]|nr:exodeoxyribonuclease VII large subunit [Desulfobacteraceae bacterium]
MQEPTFFNLSAITQRIQQILQPAIGKCFWVKAEISSGRERGGSFYCDLVETTPQGQISAQMRCTIWSKDLCCIQQKFRECNLTLNLDNGTLIGLKCSLQYSPKFGLSLNAIDADPAFALGALEIKKKQIIDRLCKEGRLEPNKALPVPTLPLRIGLVTSASSAAYNDFVQTLSLSGFGFKIYLADALVQGDRTEESVLRALATLERLPVDLVVIIRGGGSKTDLFYLDNEAIARKIAALPYPVWTGIGHETDTSVLDCVANKAFKTPTAVAEEIVSRFKEVALHLETAQNRFRTSWAYRLQNEQLYLQDAAIGVRQGTRKLLDTCATTLHGKAAQLSSLVVHRLSGEKERMAVCRNILTSAPINRIQQACRGSREWAQRIRILSQRLFNQHRTDLKAKSARYRRERFERHLNQQGHVLQDRRSKLMRSFELQMNARVHEQSHFKKRFKVANIFRRLKTEENALESKLLTIKAYDPQTSLERGFCLLYNEDGDLIKSIRNVSAGQSVRTKLHDGQVIGTVHKVEGR